MNRHTHEKPQKPEHTGSGWLTFLMVVNGLFAAGMVIQGFTAIGGGRAVVGLAEVLFAVLLLVAIVKVGRVTR